jgi:long-chain acyl-CoA synthetase
MSTPLRRPRPASRAGLPVGSADVLPRLAATAWPNRAALRAGTRTVTFAELDREVSRLAFGLRQLLGGDGLPVVVSAAPGLDFPAAFHAVLRSGNVAAPVNPRLPAASFARLLETVRPCAAVLDRAMYERVRPVLAGLELTLLLDAPADAGQLTCAEVATRGALLVEPRDRYENELAVLAGERRLTHYRLKAQAVAAAEVLTERSVVLDATPANDLTLLDASLVAGATRVLFGNPEPAAAAREAERIGATHLHLPGGVRALPASEAVAS